MEAGALTDVIPLHRLGMRGAMHRCLSLALGIFLTLSSGLVAGPAGHQQGAGTALQWAACHVQECSRGILAKNDPHSSGSEALAVVSLMEPEPSDRGTAGKVGVAEPRPQQGGQSSGVLVLRC